MSAIKRIAKELKKLSENPLPGVVITPTVDKQSGYKNYFKLIVVVDGPANTPYEGGKFKFIFTIPTNYPFKPPKVKIVTKIYHPYVDKDGILCGIKIISTVHDEWSPGIGFREVVLEIIKFLSDPSCNNFTNDLPIDEKMANEYKNDVELFRKTAKLWTSLYALDEELFKKVKLEKCMIDFGEKKHWEVMKTLRNFYLMNKGGLFEIERERVKKLKAAYFGFKKNAAEVKKENISTLNLLFNEFDEKESEIRKSFEVIKENAKTLKTILKMLERGIDGLLLIEQSNLSELELKKKFVNLNESEMLKKKFVELGENVDDLCSKDLESMESMFRDLGLWKLENITIPIQNARQRVNK